MKNNFKNSYKKFAISTLTIGSILITCQAYASSNDKLNEFFNSFDQLTQDVDKFLDKTIGNNNSHLDANDKEYTINLEIPGFDKEQITIEMQGDYLVVKGEKSKDNTDKNANPSSNQQSRNSFYQKLSLPKDINKDSISANLKNGVLTITLPKAPIKAEEMKTITIN